MKKKCNPSVTRKSPLKWRVSEGGGNSSPKHPDDVVVVVMRHKSQPHNKPIQVHVVRRWTLSAVKEAWEMFLCCVPISERGDFTLSFDETHIKGGAK